jgi:3-hydroxyisobutyrate dehydrogenase
MEKMNIGWIGTGVMGNAMCGHLLDSGHRICVFNRTRSKADNLIAKGAKWYDSPKAVAVDSDVIFAIVGFPPDVEQVFLGEQGILAGAAEGAVVVDMTTSSPELARKISEHAERKRIHALDAPVSGGDIGAREATLTIMVGGERSVHEKICPLFEIMGKNIVHMGDAGAGQDTKTCNQILVAGTMIGTVESLLYAHRVGMDLDRVIDVLGQGAARSWTINNLGRLIAKKDFNPGFFIKHFVKDMGIALAECQRMNLSLPGLALVHQLYTAAKAMGLEDLGTQGLYRVLAHINNVDI